MTERIERERKAAPRGGRGRNREGRMSLGEHLVELRKRLFIAGIAIIAGSVGGFFVHEFVWDAIRVPITELAETRNASINYTGMTEAFDLTLQVSVTVGIIISSPIWLYQILAFLVPGLTSKEKRYTFGFFFTAVPLFLLGATAGWLVFPHMANVLLGFAPEEDATLLSARYLLDFIVKLVLAVGIAFVMPVFLVLLNFIGVISAVAIIKGWRIAILLITLFTAIATPAADPLSMFLLAIPMVVLYFAAAGIAWLHDRAAAKRLAALDELPV